MGFTDVYVRIVLLDMECYCLFRKFIYIYIYYLSLAESFIICRSNFRHWICKKVIFFKCSISTSYYRQCQGNFLTEITINSIFIIRFC